MATAPLLQSIEGLIKSGETAQAIAQLRTLLDLMPNYAAAQFLLAQAYIAQKDRTAALEALNQAQFLVPNSPIILSTINELTTSPPSRKKSVIKTANVAEKAEAIEQKLASDKSAAKGETPDVAWKTLLDTIQKIEPDTDELDELIAQLEDARIEPDEAFDMTEAGGEEQEGEVVSETLARIYASQKQYTEAAHIYEQLAERQPTKAKFYRKKSDEMRKKAAASG